MQEAQLSDSIQDDLDRLRNAHCELMSCIRDLARPIYNLDPDKALEFLTTVDQMFSELVSPIYRQIEEETGIHVGRPITPEYANWLRSIREKAATHAANF